MPTYGEGRKAGVLQQRERRKDSQDLEDVGDTCTPCHFMERDGRLGYVNRGKDGTASFEVKTNFTVSILILNLVQKVPLYTWWDSQDLEDVGDTCTSCRLMERDGRLGYVKRGKDGTASYEMKTNFTVSISILNLVQKVPLYTWWDAQDLEDVGDTCTPCRLMERDGRLGYFNRGKDWKTLKSLKMWVICVHHADLWREMDGWGMWTEVKMVPQALRWRRTSR